MIEHMFDTRHPFAAAGSGIAQLQAGIVEMADEDLANWHSDPLSDQLVALLEISERLDAEVTRVAAEWTRRRGWEADAALSPAAWLTHRAPPCPDRRHGASRRPPGWSTARPRFGTRWQTVRPHQRTLLPWLQ